MRVVEDWSSLAIACVSQGSHDHPTPHKMRWAESPTGPLQWRNQDTWRGRSTDQPAGERPCWEHISALVVQYPLVITCPNKLSLDVKCFSLDLLEVTNHSHDQRFRKPRINSLTFWHPQKLPQKTPISAKMSVETTFMYIYIYTISQNHGNASWMFNQMDKSQSSATVLSKNLPPLFFDFTTLNPKMSKNVPITLQGAVTIQSIANRLWFARPTILPLLVSRRFHPRERPRPFPRFFLIQRLRRSKCGLKRKKKTVKCY